MNKTHKVMLRTFFLAMFLGSFLLTSVATRAEDDLTGRSIEVHIGFSNSGGGARFWNAIFPFLKDALPDSKIRPIFNDAANGTRAVSAVFNDESETISIGFVRPPEIAHAQLYQRSGIDFDFADAAWIVGVEKEGFIMAARTGLSLDPKKLRATKDDLFLPVSDIEATHATAGIMLSALTGIPAKIVVGFKKKARKQALLAGDVAFYTIARDEGVEQLISEGLVQELYTIVPNPEAPEKAKRTLDDFLVSNAPQVALNYAVSARAMGRAFFAEPGLPRNELDALRDVFQAVLADPEFAAAAKEQGVPFFYVSPSAIQSQADALSNLSEADKELIDRVYKCGLEMSEGTTRSCAF